MTKKFFIDEQKTAQLTIGSEEFLGVSIGEVRQNMRIWRTSAQTYLNGIKASFDVDRAVDPSLFSVGEALSQLVAKEPAISSMQEYLQVIDLHVQQHYCVEEALLLSDSDEKLTVAKLREKDKVMDNFVVVTEKLDHALADFSVAVNH